MKVITIESEAYKSLVRKIERIHSVMKKAGEKRTQPRNRSFGNLGSATKKPQPCCSK